MGFINQLLSSLSHVWSTSVLSDNTTLDQRKTCRLFDLLQINRAKTHFSVLLSAILSTSSVPYLDFLCNNWDHCLETNLNDSWSTEMGTVLEFLLLSFHLWSKSLGFDKVKIYLFQLVAVSRLSDGCGIDHRMTFCKIFAISSNCFIVAKLQMWLLLQFTVC